MHPFIDYFLSEAQYHFIARKEFKSTKRFTNTIKTTVEYFSKFITKGKNDQQV